MSWLSDVFQKGGPFFIVNTFFLAVVIGLIVERAIYFLGRGHLNAKAFLEQLRKLLSANNVDRAKKLCDATTAPVARVAKAGLNRLHRGEAAVAQAMEETMTDTLPEVKTRIGALWSLANITTLVGLLGTITGLITHVRRDRRSEPGRAAQEAVRRYRRGHVQHRVRSLDRAHLHARPPAAVGRDEEGRRRTSRRSACGSRTCSPRAARAASAEPRARRPRPRTWSP